MREVVKENLKGNATKMRKEQIFDKGFKEGDRVVMRSLQSSKLQSKFDTEGIIVKLYTSNLQRTSICCKIKTSLGKFFERNLKQVKRINEITLKRSGILDLDDDDDQVEQSDGEEGINHTDGEKEINRPDGKGRNGGYYEKGVSHEEKMMEGGVKIVKSPQKCQKVRRSPRILELNMKKMEGSRRNA